MIVGLKFLIFVFRAGNEGEDVVVALTFFVREKIYRLSKSRAKLGIVVIGLFANCLLYGDVMIIPAVSAVSAVVGIDIVTFIF